MDNEVNFKDLSQCSCFNLRKASRSITQYFDRYMTETSLRPTQFTILAVLSGQEKLSISNLALFLMMDRTTLSRNLKPLEKQKLLHIFKGEDRRVKFLSTTDKGKKIFMEAYPLWKKAQTDFLDSFGEEKWKQMLIGLGDLAELTMK